MSLSCNLPIFQSNVDIKIEYKMLSMLKDLNNHDHPSHFDFDRDSLHDND